MIKNKNVLVEEIYKLFDFEDMENYYRSQYGDERELAKCEFDTTLNCVQKITYLIENFRG